MAVLKKPTDAFSYISHFIFAVIIASSYESATDVFVNSEKPFLADPSSAILGFELLLAYTAVVSGWVGYSRSMIKWPHTNTKSGAFRFCLDIAILFCYFGLIASASPERDFQGYFLPWIIALFVLFAVWDILKLKEYHKKREKRTKWALERSLGKTVALLVLFVLVLYAFVSITESQIRIIDEHVTYSLFLALTMFLILMYRYWKWSIPPQQRSVKGN